MDVIQAMAAAKTQEEMDAVEARLRTGEAGLHGVLGFVALPAGAHQITDAMLNAAVDVAIFTSPDCQCDFRYLAEVMYIAMERQRVRDSLPTSADLQSQASSG